MAKSVNVLTPNELRSLRKAHDILAEFFVVATPTAPRVRAPRRRRPGKPTGAAAHKRNQKPKPGAPSAKKYPPIVLDAEQQATLAAQSAAAVNE